MKVALVHPAGYNWIEGKKDVSIIANRMAPLGLLSIAAWLKRRGHSVKVEDCLGPYAAKNTEETVSRVLKYEPGIVGFSATTSGFLDAYDTARRIKELRPDIKTIFGGVHICAIGAPLLENFPAIDYLCIGEGEETITELADGKNAAEINGLVFRGKEGVVSNPARQPITDLDSLPFPAYKKLEGFPKGYELPLFSYIDAPGATMITSRGCPYQCSYCDRSVFKRGYRFNSPQYIYEHIKYLRENFGVRHLNIYDDLFTLDRTRIETLCKMLIDKPLDARFNCAVRVGYADDALLSMLAKAGCLMVSLGIESGDPSLLETHKPGVYLDSVRETVARIHANGLRVKGLFMMGLPGETEESVQKTSDFALSLELDDMNMSKFTPFHGAPIWKTIAGSGELREDWRNMNCLNFVFLPNGISSWERLDYLYNTHVKRFYSSPLWRKRFAARMWQNRHSLWRLLRDLPGFLAAKRAFEPK
jgi:magnesium-protoporphyrin IX monomethyl ester (oxidative) cyclase